MRDRPPSQPAITRRSRTSKFPKRGAPTRWATLQKHRRKADDLGIATEAEVETIKPNARIIAALEQLEAALAAPENKEWLASRREIGRQIDSEAVDVTWCFAPVLDPYGLCKPLPDKLHLIGREYLARSIVTPSVV